MNRLKSAWGLLTAFAFICASTPASATLYGWRFMQDGFLYGISEEEAAAFKQSVKGALEASADKHVVTWKSEDGDRPGKILPRFTYTSRGTTCRRTLFQLELDEGPTSVFRLDICTGDSGWEVFDPPAKLSQADADHAEQFLRGALSTVTHHEPVTWHAEESGHSASVVILDPMVNAPGECRNTAISLLDSKGRSISGRYAFCLNDEGIWKYKPSENAPADAAPEDTSTGA